MYGISGIMLRKYHILVEKLLVIGINYSRVYESRSNQRKCVFIKNKAIVDLEHRLGLVLSTI